MARTQTIVQLSDDLVRALDAEAARRGISRSALVREAVIALLAEQSVDAVDRAILAGYSRIPPATPDDWGDLGGATVVATGETLRRLDAEEERSGLPPW